MAEQQWLLEAVTEDRDSIRVASASSQAEALTPECHWCVQTELMSEGPGALLTLTSQAVADFQDLKGSLYPNRIL